MYYVIDRVRWNGRGHLDAVCWHSVDFDGEQVKKGDSQQVPVVDAAHACRDHEVRVYVPGDTGHYFKLRACEEGLEAELENGQTLRERLAHLPAF